MSGTSITTASSEERTDVRSFYERCGYSRPFADEEVLFVAKARGRIIGAVRLAEEFGVLVLRGMFVDSSEQRKGVGSALLFALSRAIGQRDSYCIPYDHLIDFYGQTGFVPIKVEAAPGFLQARLLEYKSLGKKVLLLKRPKSHLLTQA